MKEKVTAKTILKDSFDQTKKVEGLSNEQQLFDNKYFTFFEYSHFALWIEDFSIAKRFIDKIVKEKKTDIKSYIANNPSVIPELVTLIKVNDVNITAVKLFKAKDKADLLGNLNKVFTKKSHEGFSHVVVDILLGEKEIEFETVNRTLEGNEIDVLIKFKVVDGSEDSFENVIVSVEDITDRLKSRNELEESEKRYKLTNSIAKLGNWHYDYRTKETIWSDEIFDLIGVEQKTHKLNLDFYLSIIHKDDIGLVDNFGIDFLLKNPVQNLKYRILTAKGELKYISEKRTIEIKNNRIERIIGICQDITESSLSEQKLNETKNMLSNTLSNIDDGFVILDPNSNYLYVNNRAASVLGRTPQELIGKNIWSEFPEKEGDLFYDNYQKALKSNKPIIFENYFKPWDKWFENRIIPSNDGVLIFFQEITDKKRKENKIKEAYNIINKSSSVAFLCKNEEDFPLVFVSENTLELFGYPSEDFLNNKLKTHQFVFPGDLEILQSEFSKLNESTDFKGFKSKPFRIVTKQGETKWIKANIDVIRNKQNEITFIQGILEDISEQIKAENLFFESNQRLKDQFSNTPLASIMWDLDFRVTEWNNSAQRIFGYSFNEAIGKHAGDLIIPPDIGLDIQKVWENLLVQKGGYRHTNENVTKDGNTIICKWYNVTLKDSKGNVTGVASLAEDITEIITSKKLIEKSEKRYRDIFEQSFDPVLIIKNGIFVDCNESTLKMFGYTNKESLLEVHPSKISPETQPDGRDSFEKAEEMMEIALDKGSNRFRWCHKQKNGHVFSTEVTLTRIDKNDATPSIHTVINDISEKVKKEALEEVIYNISNAALSKSDFKEFSAFVKTELQKIIDTRNFYIALYNEKTETITTPFIVDEKEEIKKFSAKKTLTGHIIKSKKSLRVNKESLAKLIANEKIDLLPMASKNWLGVPLKIKEKVFGAIVVQSYLDENAFNENDVNLLEFVADQISVIIQRKKSENELKNALERAQESEKLKSAFLANMSHEIRTPMNGIIGFSELFSNPDLSEIERKKYARIVINSSNQLLSIVNDVLDISKIEAGVIKLNNERVNLNQLFDDIYAFYNPIAIENNLILNYVKGLENFKSVIEIDKTKLNQVLTNLLSNAFKFTNKGSVEFGYQLQKNELQFYVKDTGIGIDEKLQDKIFERFTQADIKFDKNYRGTGLGLSISKKFVELFNGKIWLSSNKQGTTIYFTIPYTKVQGLSISSVTAEINRSDKIINKELTILVAEDEEYNMLFINELFSKSKFKIFNANNGKEAVKLAQKHPEIDLVLMDIKMPIMNGNEAMLEIKKEAPHIPIIALSAFAMESDKEKALKRGFDSYLSKPIKRKTLFELIDKHTK